MTQPSAGRGRGTKPRRGEGSKPRRRDFASSPSTFPPSIEARGEDKDTLIHMFYGCSKLIPGVCAIFQDSPGVPEKCNQVSSHFFPHDFFCRRSQTSHPDWMSVGSVGCDSEEWRTLVDFTTAEDPPGLSSWLPSGHILICSSAPPSVMYGIPWVSVTVVPKSNTLPGVYEFFWQTFPSLF